MGVDKEMGRSGDPDVVDQRTAGGRTDGPRQSGPKLGVKSGVARRNRFWIVSRYSWQPARSVPFQVEQIERQEIGWDSVMEPFLRRICSVKKSCRDQEKRFNDSR
ncbi:MAG: hypothetical protein R3C97_12980 [Geminicoccaceae bacterium]